MIAGLLLTTNVQTLDAQVQDNKPTFTVTNLVGITAIGMNNKKESGVTLVLPRFQFSQKEESTDTRLP